MLAAVRSATLVGVDGQPVTVEVHVSPGLPAYTVVGLPDAAVRESRERVPRGDAVVGVALPNVEDHGEPRAGRCAQDRLGPRARGRARAARRDRRAAVRRARRRRGARRARARRVGAGGHRHARARRHARAARCDVGDRAGRQRAGGRTRVECGRTSGADVVRVTRMPEGRGGVATVRICTSGYRRGRRRQSRRSGRPPRGPRPHVRRDVRSRSRPRAATTSCTSGRRGPGRPCSPVASRPCCRHSSSRKRWR